jgi:hypothetical protein
MTTIDKTTNRDVLDRSDLNETADVLKRIKAGTMFSRIRVQFAALSAAAAIDITTAASKAAITALSGITLDTGENLPAIGTVHGLQVVTSGTAASLGSYITAPTGTPPAGATPLIPPGGAQLAVGIASLSDDGKTLTFPNTVTGFILVYSPAPAVSLDAAFPVSAP